MSTGWRRSAAALLAGAALLMAGCTPEPPAASAVRQPLGQRQALHTGLWRGQVGNTLVDFAIQQVAEGAVTVRVSGTVLRRAGEPPPASVLETYFYDRPRSCKRVSDGRTFDCTRYTDMHIDNGLLCGVYAAPDQVYRPCLDPLP